MKEKRFTYHYVIIIACFLMMAATVGITVNTFTIISPAMIEDLGITATQAQLISLVSTLANMVAGLFVGKLMARFGMRKTMTVGTILMCGGFALRGAASTMLTLCASNFVCGLGMAEISTIPSGVLVNNWFSMEKKGTMSGIAFTGSVVGGILFVQVATALMKVYDWRVTHYVLAAVCAVLMLPISMFVVRARPEEKGLLPLGVKSGDKAASAPLTGISAGKFLKTGSFWLLAASMFIIGFINMGMQNNFSIYMQDELGHSEGFSTNVFTLVMGIQIVGKVVLGAVYDKKGVKFGTAYCTVLFLLAAGCSLKAGGTGLAIAFGAFFGLVCSMTTVTPPYLTMLVVGRRNYSVIYGLLSLFYGVGVAVGPVVAAKVFDGSGSYAPAWIAFMVLALVMAVATVAGVRRSAEYSAAAD